METTSKDLVQLEHNHPSVTPLESALLVCRKGSQPAQMKKPTFVPLPKSQLLGKMSNFLGVFSEANKKLQLDAKDNPDKYDIEALTGDESQVVNVECIVGVVDLQTPEAVAAAEAAVSGYQSVIPGVDGSSESESDDTKSDDDEESSDINEDDDCNGEDKKTPGPGNSNSLSVEVSNKRAKKRSKIVELS